MPNPIPSVHPLSADMHRLIEEKLAQIAQEQQVNILFACESGSRGWGFASTDSDYDVRFIYVPRLSWYLCVEAGRDVIEQPISGDLDISGWELRKTLGLLRFSNPTLLEWLRSPIIYRSQPPWVGACTHWQCSIFPHCAVIIITCRWRKRTCIVICKRSRYVTKNTFTRCARCSPRVG